MAIPDREFYELRRQVQALRRDLDNLMQERRTNKTIATRRDALFGRALAFAVVLCQAASLALLLTRKG